MTDQGDAVAVTGSAVQCSAVQFDSFSACSAVTPIKSLDQRPNIPFPVAGMASPDTLIVNFTITFTVTVTIIA
jgi:hypothetical protein